jgi:hypothetical protein
MDAQVLAWRWDLVSCGMTVPLVAKSSLGSVFSFAQREEWRPRVLVTLALDGGSKGIIRVGVARNRVPPPLADQELPGRWTIRIDRLGSIK